MTAPSPVVPFTTATAVRKVTSNSWTATLIQDYCVGAVPNGGYVGSVLHQVVSQHLSAQGQRQDIISAQLQYLNRTQVGEATIVVEDVKRGRATSTIHATLLQQQGSSPAAEQRKCILAYFVCAAPSPDGLTLATGWTLHPPPPPVNLDRVAEGLDPNWSSTAGRVQTSHLDAVGFVRHVERVLESFYRREPARRGLDDVWLRLTTGERFTNATLPLVADAKPYVVERWRPSPAEEEAGPFPSKEAFWYPTLVMNLDIKKLLPPEGVEWLFLRTEARMIDQGRLDLQVYILDQHGDLIALASHINLIVSAARNLGTKGGKGRL